MTVKQSFSRDDLRSHQPRHDSIVCIDSDGCVFDSMEVKQRECFHGEIIRHWSLGAVEAAVRETAEFVNLYSVGRGRNRFLSLCDVMALLRERPDVRAAGIDIPRLDALQAFIDSGAALGNASLAQAVAENADPELTSVLAWSEQVNRHVEALPEIPMFAAVPPALDRLRDCSDCLVVSQTPEEALVREWQQHGIADRVFAIAGQELGTKAQHIDMATAGRYSPQRVLMIGDAPGDLAAARENGVCFYPINPGREEASWRRFTDEAYDRFLDARYSGAYEAGLIEEFEQLLPARPPWRT